VSDCELRGGRETRGGRPAKEGRGRLWGARHSHSRGGGDKPLLLHPDRINMLGGRGVALATRPPLLGARSSGAAAMSFEDGRPDPAWQRDSILLLAYCGVEDLIRSASTGLKAMPGFDLAQLNSEMATALVVAIAWLLAALATGVLAEQRYNRSRLLFTWLLAAPAAAAFRLLIFGGLHDPAAVGEPISVLTDAVATLLLQNALRLAEEQGIV
jgi:hypothetical protein